MATARSQIPFTKGHGTGNDFVIVPDYQGLLDLSPALVAGICDRRTGIGADGLLRVVRCRNEAEALDQVDSAEWFMDYRNADGSLAEMCGNGARVFARFLMAQGLVSSRFAIASRSGLHAVVAEPDGTITVEVGVPLARTSEPAPIVRVGDFEWTGDAWWMPNPHAVVFVDDLSQAGPLLDPPAVVAGDLFPNGQNVEFVVDHTTDTHSPTAQMRVYERGVGETDSCGTGACAVALSVRARHRVSVPGSVVVDVPGGRLRVFVGSTGSVSLNGPAVLVGSGALEPEWVDAQD
ncbi:MAG: diaminopimelate epimerase [Actinomycetes bacterium]